MYGPSYLKTMIKTNIYKNGILNILVQFQILQFRVKNLYNLHVKAGNNSNSVLTVTHY